MKILCTTSRMPFAVDEIRKLGEQGHQVYAADTFRTAPGSHSAEVHERVVVPAPKQETEAFVTAVAELVEREGIELIVPMFEDVFYLAKHRDRLPSTTRLFCPPFEVLAQVHDKASFLSFCGEIGVPVPATVVATSPDELARGDRGVRPVLRPRRVLARRCRVAHQHRSTRRCRRDRRRDAYTRQPVGGAGLRRGQGPVQLQRGARRQGGRALHLRAPAHDRARRAVSSSCRSTSRAPSSSPRRSRRPPATRVRCRSTGWCTTTTRSASSSAIPVRPTASRSCTPTCSPRPCSRRRSTRTWCRRVG